MQTNALLKPNTNSVKYLDCFKKIQTYRDGVFDKRKKNKILDFKRLKIKPNWISSYIKNKSMIVCLHRLIYIFDNLRLKNNCPTSSGLGGSTWTACSIWDAGGSTCAELVVDTVWSIALLFASTWILGWVMVDGATVTFASAMFVSMLIKFGQENLWCV